MKITFYTDIEPWMSLELGGSPWNFIAYSRPSVPKPETAVRYSFTIDVPDPAGESVGLGEVEASEDLSA